MASSLKHPVKSIIVGLGSPIRSDDRVGIEVARRLHLRLDDPEFELVEMATGGIQLVEALVGYDRAIVIDAIQTEGGEPGRCYRLELERMVRVPGFSHQFGLLEGLELGRRLKLRLPTRLSVWVIEVEDPFTIGTEMTKQVGDAVPDAVDMIMQEETLE